ncbi:MAG: CocE/NonD family hydrolase [Proteobacteria bacterium]|nr:CocE/NonD family hydrolase [Pseudomonadota bacterium]
MVDISGLESFSVYLPMRDGVRIAVQVLGAAGFRSRHAPAVTVFTRYGRATPLAIAEAPFSESLAFTELGFVVLSVDVRGTGASFGCRPQGRSQEELGDCGEVFDWAAAQSWSDGRIFCTGVSYGGNVADLVQSLGHPALVAVAPRFTDFDLYEHLLFPGGMPNTLFTRVWGELTAALDRGETAADQDPGAEARLRARYVDGDTDGELYRQALADHAGNTDFTALMAGVAYREQLRNGANLREVAATLGPRARPAYHWASWMDAGTAAGALERFAALDAPMRVRIGLWNHGAVEHADPLGESCPLSADERRADIEDIADFFFAASAGVPRRRIEYRTAGRPGWRSTDRWPPPEIETRDLWLSAGGRLTAAPPQDEDGVDHYTVDFEAGSGSRTRWTTQVGTPVDYPDRASADARLLIYESEPLAGPLEITGTPELGLWLSSTRQDGLLIAYLEAVSADGRVDYLTEGGLRLRHRRLGAFSEAEAEPLTPGEPVQLSIVLWPLSVVLPPGARLRLAIAGADKDTFARVPTDGAVTLRLFRSAAMPSWIRIPQVIP